ncbi:MAG: nucleoside kinase [Bacteroidaceae bacterium]|nr:nucleoside kinase [Bacteroidaceae bacterium]
MITPKLRALMAENRRWQRIVGLSTVSQLNEAVKAGYATTLINVTEALQERKIAAVADEIQKLGSRLVLLAGPSSSGKTTTCKRLSIQLGACGLRPVGLSMDDYFVNREDTPRDEAGEYDFECLQALDIPYFNQQLKALLAGETVELPKYDFIQGKRVSSGVMLKLRPKDVLIVEGIHALNPDLTPDIDPADKFQLYVSALITIQLDDKQRISTSDNRLLRRIVRDFQFRGYSAQDTLHRWPSVRAGEEKWIFPYQENCDMMINSALLYEMSVLKGRVVPLLKSVPESAPEKAEAERLLQLVEFFEPIPEKQIPHVSLLREFLGGSSFEY